MASIVASLCTYSHLGLEKTAGWPVDRGRTQFEDGMIIFLADERLTAESGGRPTSFEKFLFMASLEREGSAIAGMVAT